MWKKNFGFGFALSLSLLAGCAASTEAPTPDEPTESLGAETHWAGGWRYYDLEFDCQNASLKNAVKAKSQRHVYGFAAASAGEVTFDLAATWPKSLGAFLMVLDDVGTLVDWTYATTNSAKLAAKLPAAGNYWVFASPVWYEKVKTAYSYTLTAKCGGGLCAEYTTSDGRYYAKNFSGADAAAAQQWVQADPLVSSSGVNPGSCDSLNGKVCPSTDPPVCGVPISSDKEQTFASLCEFQKVVRKAAGASGESKGKYWAGACADGYCATATLSPPEVNSPTFYAKNFSTKGDAEAWLGASFSSNAATQIENGHCNEPGACITLYKPVCGTIKDGTGTTYSNSCAFEAAVKGDAGETGESKGYYTGGACAPVCDYTKPNQTWVAKSADKCMLVKYYCTPPSVPFSNECGCGCETP